MIHREITPTTLHAQFTSVSQIAATPVHDLNFGHEVAPILQPGRIAGDFDGYGEVWYGVASRAAALNIIRGNGWEDGVTRTRAIFETLQQEKIEGAHSIKRRRVWGDDGDDVDADRLRNDPATAFSRRRRARVNQNGRVIRIFAQIGANTTTTADALFYAGAAALFLCDALESAGYRCELIAARYGEGAGYKRRKNYLITVPVKHADDPADPDEIAATLCLAGFNRTYFWHAAMTFPYKTSDTLGATSNLTPSLLESAGMYQDGDIIAPLLRTQEEAIEFLQAALSATWTNSDQSGYKLDNIPATDGSDPNATPAAPTPAPSKAPRESGPPAPGTAIVATGATYPHRISIKAAGFKWYKNPNDKADAYWYADRTSAPANALGLAGLTGVTFADN